MNLLSLFNTSSQFSIANLLTQKPVYRFYLTDFTDKRHRTNVMLSQTKCHLEILREGIMVVGNFSKNDAIIPILKNEIESITLKRGKEVVDTFYWSPMSISSKLGIPRRISRYFQIYPWEYKISETQITIRCEEFQLKLITDGNKFEKLIRRFKKTGYSKELDLIQKPSLNLLNFNA